MVIYVRRLKWFVIDVEVMIVKLLMKFLLGKIFLQQRDDGLCLDRLMLICGSCGEGRQIHNHNLLGL